MPRLPPASGQRSEELTIRSQHTEVQSTVFRATSLEAVPKLLLSIEPRQVQPLAAREVLAISQLLATSTDPGRRPQHVERHAVENAIYIGRARKNRRVDQPYSDEPCLYLIFPYLTQRVDMMAQQLLTLVIIPSFEEALANFQPPQILGGSVRPAGPRSQRSTPNVRQPFEYHVRAHENDDILATNTTPDAEANLVARKQIHYLAWKHMQFLVSADVTDLLAPFRDMVLVLLISDVDHTVSGDATPANADRTTSSQALEEALSFYEGDLDFRYISAAKAVCSVQYNMKLREVDMVGVSRGTKRKERA